MEINLYVDYYLHPGQRIYASVTTADGTVTAEMQPAGGERNHARISLPDDCREVQYTFFVESADGTRREWGRPHRLITGNASVYNIYDHWHDLPGDKPFFTSAFTECILHRDDRSAPQPSMAGMVTFEVFAPMVDPDHTVAIAGESKALGGWDVRKAVKMTDADFPCWRATVVRTDDMHEGSEFKFLIVKKDTGAPVRWEDCDNRRMPATPATVDATVVGGMHFADLRLDARWRGAGTAIPVFSLRSDTDWGVGEFLDLMPMIDWAAASGQTFIQVLPVNDTTMSHTWEDSYPYNANSTFALHPMYLRVSEMGRLDKKRMQWYETRGAELNALAELDYAEVNALKNAYTRELFDKKGHRETETREFTDFVEANASWLHPYAAYCILRDRERTPDFSRWGEYSVYDPDKADRLLAENDHEARYVYWLQYHLDKQMRRVQAYAHSRGVAIKGDIPIGISRSSADAWQQPELFNMQSQAGAPPDDFSVIGQNWGFPTYNWEVMSRDGYAWWRSRFTKMSEYFDAYRIDHVLGFFRIWEIPLDAVHGLLGHFNPALPFTSDEMRERYDFWIEPDVHTVPYIREEFLDDFFGEYADEAKARFLVEDAEPGVLRLREELNTQRKVADYFASRDNDEKNALLCHGLMMLIDEVLFIRDKADPTKYHPRISAQKSHVYRSLGEYERWCFDRLYNDFFYYRHNDFWFDGAMRKLPPLIDATDMLVCAEDLGMIPACVPTVMDRQKIIALELQRMPKEYGVAFGDTRKYPYLSVCTTSTHDMPGIRGWWEEDPERAQQYFSRVLHQSGDAPATAEAWLCERIINLHLTSPAMLCILPLQDWLSIDSTIRRADPKEEQINEPQNSRHYWRYRMHLTVDDLLALTAFTKRVKSLIKAAGR